METVVILTVVILALVLVVTPLVRRDRQPAGYAPADLDADVARYHEAMRADTLCAHCAEASPPGSRYCMRCGRRFTSPAAADA